MRKKDIKKLREWWRSKEVYTADNINTEIYALLDIAIKELEDGDE
jgi:hypothetical protein